MLGRRFFPVLLVCFALALGLVACGGDDDDDGGGATASGGSDGGGQVDKAAVESVIKPYIGQPSAFPVTDPLKEVKTGATIAFMDCGTPICGLFWEILQPAAKTMGVKLTRYKTGQAANTVTSAYDSAVAAKPDAVIAAALDVELWKNQLKQFQDAGIPVVTTGILGTEQYGIEAAQAAEDSSELAGKLMANYVAANFGADSNVAVYDIPELSFTRLTAESFETELKAVCPTCSSRTVAHSDRDAGQQGAAAARERHPGQPGHQP